MQNARAGAVVRVARATMFATATAAVVLTDCGNVALYGCPPDVCTPPAQDAGTDSATVPFYGGACPGSSCPDASDDAADATTDADDATTDAAGD